MYMLNEICENSKLINLFVELAKIPSPSLKEELLTKKIIEICNNNRLDVQKDTYGNIIINLPATDDCKDVLPILFSAHMDVVGGSE
ncbi:MAG: hypothetical protein PHV68_08740, partial [Candidatus Gastranaerophilales bacterium]|nr:hypothetical protein [Candidatus Gastranaerophilales bacterium]